MKSDPEFAAKLVKAAKLFGWNGDYTEIISFVQWVHEEMGLPIPTDEELNRNLDME